MVFAIAGVVAGLSVLYFTKSQRGKGLQTFRNAAWVLTFLLLFSLLWPFISKWTTTESTLPTNVAVSPDQQAAMHDSLATALPHETIQPAASASQTRPMASGDRRQGAWVSLLEREHHVQPGFSTELISALTYEAKRAGISPTLVLGVIEQTSQFRKYYIGPTPSDPRGYMAVAAHWSSEIGDGNDTHMFQTQTNLRMGCVILRHYLDQSNGDANKALGLYAQQAYSTISPAEKVKFVSNVWIASAKFE